MCMSGMQSEERSFKSSTNDDQPRGVGRPSSSVRGSQPIINRNTNLDESKGGVRRSSPNQFGSRSPHSLNRTFRTDEERIINRRTRGQPSSTFQASVHQGTAQARTSSEHGKSNAQPTTNRKRNDKIDVRGSTPIAQPFANRNATKVQSIEFKTNLLKAVKEPMHLDAAQDKTDVAAIGNVTLPGTVSHWDDPRLPDLFAQFRLSDDGQDKENPTPIQKVLWPCVLSGLDVLAIAPTGSGKTLGFLLPVACHAAANPPKDGELSSPSCLVLGPTRELVGQIASVMQSVAELANIQMVLAYGGTSSDDERQLKRNKRIDVLFATPGRLLDLVTQRKWVNLSRVSMFVLDEADRMLQMGMNETVESIASFCPPNRVTIMTSATWTRASEDRLSSWMNPKGHVRIMVGTMVSRENGGTNSREENVTLNEQVEQEIHVCAEHKKPRKLIRHLERLKAQGQAGMTIVFCNKIKAVQFVFDFLSRQRLRVGAIHGEMPQIQREKVLESFRTENIDILVATDVAGRGLDIPNLVHVVNYDFPPSIPQYMHRIGRCGRTKTRRGCAMSFFTRNLKVMAPDLVRVLESTKQKVDPNLAELAREMQSGDPRSKPDNVREVGETPGPRSPEAPGATQQDEEPKDGDQEEAKSPSVEQTLLLPTEKKPKKAKMVQEPTASVEVKADESMPEDEVNMVSTSKDDDIDWMLDAFPDDDQDDEEAFFTGDVPLSKIDNAGSVPLVRFVPGRHSSSSNQSSRHKRKRVKT